MLFDVAHSDLGVVTGIAPAAAVTDNTPFVSTILDMQGKLGAEFVFVTGTNADADATATVLVEESATSNMAGSNAVADDDLLGTELLAGFTFADDGEPRKIGYRGAKRYIRVTITPANNTGNQFLAGLWLFKDDNGPEPNPPV